MHPTHPRRRPWPTVLLLAVTALLLALFALVLVAPPVGAHSLVLGEVGRVPGPSPLPWLAGAALLAMAVVAAGRTRRWSDALVAALALVVALDLVQAAGAWAAGAWAAAQTPLAGKLLSLGASAAGWVVAGLAIRQLRRRRVESGLFQLLLAAGLLTVVGGLGDLGFLFRSELASTLPAWVVRAAVTAKIGLGLGALAAAGLRLPGTVDTMTDGPGADDPAEDEPVLATVLPWPGGRRFDSFDDLDDPDLPGGA
jgi:hypothetical protein